MAITAEQRAERRGHIGSSDSPPILGVDEYKSAADVWIEKTADVDDGTNEAIDIGNAFEGPLLDWAAEQLGVEIERDVSLFSREDPLFSANLDAKVKGRNRREGIEAKTTSIAGSFGAEGTDEIPDRVIVQCQHQMFVAELDKVWVPVLTADFGRLARRLYEVHRNEDIINAIKTEGRKFWENFVLPKVMPTGVIPSLEVLKRVKRIPEDVAMVDPEIVISYEEAKERNKAAEKEAKAAQARLIAAMGVTGGADWGDPEYIYLYPEVTRSVIDTKKLMQQFPDVYEQVKTSSSHNRLTRKKR